MNLGFVNAVSAHQPIQIQKFTSKSNIKEYPADSFEKSSAVSRTFSKDVKALKHPRTKNLKAMMEFEAERKRIFRAEFSKKYSALQTIFEQLNEKVCKGSISLFKLQRLISDNSLSDYQKEGYKELYKKTALEVKALIEQYEVLKRDLDKFYESPKARIAGISDMRIDLAPENIDFYKSFAEAEE